MGMCKVLVVDDDQQARRAVRASLERAGYGVTEVDGVRPALETLKRDTFDAVVLDMVMPNDRGCDDRAGFVVLEAIARKWPRSAILILTAYDSLDNLETLEFGADAYLAKTGSGRWETVTKTLPRVLKTVLEGKNKVIPDPSVADDVKRARNLQRTGFPVNLTGFCGNRTLSVAGKNLPAVWVSGDTYDFRTLADNTQIAFMLCDAKGHGLAAALVAMHLRAIFRMGIENGWSLTAIDAAMNDHLDSPEDDAIFATGVIGVLHVQSRWIELLTAGHHVPPSIVRRGGPRTSPTKERVGALWGLPIERQIPCLDRFDFGPGQSVVFSSDGLMDIRNNKDVAFGDERVHRAHQRFHGEDASELCNHVLYDALKFADHIAPREDDLTILALHWPET